MDKQMFVKDVHEYVDSIFTKCDEYRNVLIDIYLQLFKITSENNIPCFAAYGTLLGAVRDGCDMLPWDMDIDVMIPINYHKKLIECFEKMNSDYSYIGVENTKKYSISELRIYKKGYNPNEFHVDIFYIVGAPDKENKQIKFTKKINKLFRQRLYKYRDLTEFKKESKVLYLLKYMQNKIIGYLPGFYINKAFNKILYGNNIETSEYFTIICEDSKCFKTEMLKHSFNKKCNQLTYTILEDYDIILKAYYGDYDKYLPIENRYKEFYNGVQRKNKC